MNQLLQSHPQSRKPRKKRNKKQKPQPQKANYNEDFPGIDFSTHRMHATVGHRRSSTIRGEGIQLRIPPNAFQRSINISLQGCVSGPFILPDDIQLASPVFLVRCTPQRRFQQQSILTLQHFVHLQNREECEKMVLLTSPQEIQIEDEEGFYWKFSIADQQPHCFPHTSCGEVELTNDHFGFLCFGIRQDKSTY